MPRTRRHGINTVGDLIAVLEDFDPELSIVIERQPQYPIFANISDVYGSIEDDGDVVVIESGTEGYSPKQVLKGG